VEEAKNRILEAVGLDGGPLGQAIGRQTDAVHGFFDRGVGVEGRLAQGFVGRIEFVGNGVLGGQLRLGVDLFVKILALLGVFFAEVLFVKILDFVEMDLLFFIIQGTETLAALEEKMFEVVRQASGFGGVVFRSGPHHDFGVKARF
jgi:hypothetical protein